MTTSTAAIHVDLSRVLGPIDPRIYSGFTEHMGRCIYGGIYDPDAPDHLKDEQGFRTDVLDALKDVRVPIVRYPGGNFVSSYRWTDGVGPRERRPRRLELAWRGEESNQFGTDEFMTWCNTLGAEPFICLNMGTGTLEDALAWLEYMNGTAQTLYANMRRKNGHEEPYKVKYLALGNEVWGPWQVGQAEARDYAKAARQWAKALKLVDPSIQLVACGKEGYDDWDRIIINELVDVVEYFSLHLYTKGKTHDISVVGSAAAQKGIEMTMQLVDLARIAKGVVARPGICFDEWQVWDPVIADGEKGAEQVYTLSDALSVASWLNVFVRTPDVKIACLAQSVNVISPLTTSPNGLLKQTSFHSLRLFANYMRGTALDIFVESSRYEGETDLPWVQSVCQKQLTWIDATAALDEETKTLNIAIVNRHATTSFDVALEIAATKQGWQLAKGDVEVFEIHHADLGAINSWDEPEKVKTVKTIEALSSTVSVKAGSIRLLRVQLSSTSTNV